MQAQTGHDYYMANEFGKAVEVYDQTDRSQLDEVDLSSYAMSAFFLQQYVKSLEIAMLGLTKYPQQVNFSRLAFFCCTEQKQWDDALRYADVLFGNGNQRDTSYYEYAYYGRALAGKGQYERGIAMFTKYLETTGNSIASDLAVLAGMYSQYATTQTGAAREDALMRADTLYAEMAERHESTVEYVTLMRARVNSQLDPDQSKGLALPYYQKLAALIETKADKGDNDRTRLIESYHYLIAYYFTQMDDKDTAKQYAQKLINIDPENETARKVLSL